MTAKRKAKGSFFFFFFAFNSFGSYANSWEKIPIKSNMVLGHFKYKTAYTTGAVNFDLMGPEEADCWVGTEPFFGITPTLFRKTMPKKLEIFKECFFALETHNIESDLNTLLQTQMSSDFQERYFRLHLKHISSWDESYQWTKVLIMRLSQLTAWELYWSIDVFFVDFFQMQFHIWISAAGREMKKKANK